MFCEEDVNSTYEILICIRANVFEGHFDRNINFRVLKITKLHRSEIVRLCLVYLNMQDIPKLMEQNWMDCREQGCKQYHIGNQSLKQFHRS